MHDDVHGTAVVTLGAALVACRNAGLTLHEEVVGQIGLGAAGFGIAALMVDAGAKKVLGSDPNSASHDRARAKAIEIADMQTLLREADVVVATTGGPGLIKPEMVRQGQVIMALANPAPEIEPEDALAAVAAFGADGKGVNSVLGYPGIFRGALLSGAKQINPEMKLAAANVIAELASGAELVPNALEPTVHERVAGAVRDAAIMSRSEEHTSELQSANISYAVFCLKKKRKILLILTLPQPKQSLSMLIHATIKKVIIDLNPLFQTTFLRVALFLFL